MDSKFSFPAKTSNPPHSSCIQSMPDSYFFYVKQGDASYVSLNFSNNTRGAAFCFLSAYNRAAIDMHGLSAYISRIIRG